MIPSTFVGLVLFVASLGPGYVYVRVAEKRRPRADRSALMEAAEMASIGGLASLLVAVLVLSVGDTVGALDATAIGRDPQTYLFDHPARLLGALVVTVALSFGAAATAAVLTHGDEDKAFEPGLTAWQQLFFWDLPEGHSTVLLAELRDGRRISGQLRTFTAEFEENRELGLASPIQVAAKGQRDLLPTTDGFVVLRESDVLAVSGIYRVVQSEKA